NAHGHSPASWPPATDERPMNYAPRFAKIKEKCKICRPYHVRMDSPRAILHVDMDAFYAAIEQLDDPALRGKPILVGGDGPRGVVTTASYEARPFGCHSAQPMAVAKRLSPQAIIVPPRFCQYREASAR